MTLPIKLYAGDAWTLEHIEASPRPAAQFRIHINSLAIQFTSDPVVSVDGRYRFEMLETKTRTFAPGQYIIAITCLELGKRSTILTGHLMTVEPDPATASSFSFLRRKVFALRALEEGRITAGDAVFSTMSIKGRAVSKLSLAEIHDARVQAEVELAAEELSAQADKGVFKNKNFLRVRFPGEK